MATYGIGGAQGGRAIENPRYNTYTRTLPITGLNGQLAILNAGTPIDFDRVTGHQKITMFFGTVQPIASCSFSIKGGTNQRCSEGLPIFPNPQPMYDRTINFQVTGFQNGCDVQALPPPPRTSKNVRINRFTVAVPSQNRYFLLAMAPFAIVPSTISFPLTGSFVGYTAALAAVGAPQALGVFLHVTSVTPGTVIMPGQAVLATTILNQVSGDTGGVGVYTLAVAQNSVSATIVTTQPSPITTDIEMQIKFYRGVPYMREAGIPVSFGPPDYYERVFTTLFPGGPNPLDLFAALPFSRFPGQQDIVVTNLTTGFYFSFSVDYGILGQAGGYLGLPAPNADAKILSGPENCTIDPIPVPIDQQILQQTLGFLVITPTDPQGARAYTFVFAPAPYTQTPPTIQLINNFPFGVDSVEVKVVTRQFRTI